MWCIPPKHSGEFVFHMEDVLEVYQRPYDPRHPVICIDETFKQLIGEERSPLPTRPGDVERYDSVYVRKAWRACSCSSSRWPAGGTSS